ncbi:hypothetical protein Tco_0500535 [Tanacetum coccineum]
MQPKIACGLLLLQPKMIMRKLRAESIVRAASPRVRFRLSTTPFCSASSCAATGRMFSAASTAAMSTFVGVYGPSKMDFLRYSPFDLVSRYRRKRERH